MKNEKKGSDLYNKLLNYSNFTVDFSFGLGDFLNSNNLLNVENLLDNVESFERDDAIKLVSMINIKRFRFLEMALVSPNLKPHQVRGIELAINIINESNASLQKQTKIELVGINNNDELEKFEEENKNENSHE